MGADGGSVTLIIILIIIGLLVLNSMIMVVGQQTVAVTEIFGRFADVKPAGLRFKFPWPVSVEARMPSGRRMSMRLRELRHTVSVKTADNAFVDFPVAVQFRVRPDRVKEAFYELEDPEGQITSFVLNVVRAEGAKSSLEDLYTAKLAVELAVKQELGERLAAYGYDIVNVLVDQPQPSEEVQRAFNRVIAARREQEAARNLAEAERIRRVGIALAEKESKQLQGEGIAQQRLAIANGYRDAMENLKHVMPDVSEETILAMLMMTNHWDTIRDAAQAEGNVILLNGSGESAMQDLAKLAAAFRMTARDGTTPAQDPTQP